MKWLMKNKKGDLKGIMSSQGINEVIGRLLINRGYETVPKVEEFFRDSYNDLHSFKLLKGSLEGAEIIKQNIEENAKIRIIGDYDVDGIISTYVLYQGLKKCGADVDFDIPHRIEDGYGISIALIEKAFEEGINTIVTCDNGIAALEEISHAKELGLTVIVSDHHDIPYVNDGDEKEYLQSEADVIINPKQSQCNYPFDKICGAGVAFKFLQAVYDICGIDIVESYMFIEYIAIATVCDVVDLVDENRTIVKIGLEKLSETTNIGLKALINKSGINNAKLSSYHLGFVIGPCLNASGRLDTAIRGLKLLLETNEDQAEIMAEELVEMNNSRKDMTKDGVVKAIEKIENSSIKNDRVLVVLIEETHESLAGIIAGRIREKYYKPTIILTEAKEGLKGSGRSVEAYDMFVELTKCKDLLGRFGGHPMAAGMSLELDKLDQFRKQINSVCTLSEEELEPKLSLDALLPIHKISEELIHEISLLEPYGKANPKPVFGEKNVLITEAKIIGKNKNVLKLRLKDKSGMLIDGIFFGDIDKFREAITNRYGISASENVFERVSDDYYVDIAFYPDINSYNGRNSLQAIISAFK